LTHASTLARCWFVVWCGACASDPAAIGSVPLPDELRDQAGWEKLIDWAALPTLAVSSTHVFSTHERPQGEPFTPLDPGNKDYNSFLAVCGDRPALSYQQVDRVVACEPGQTGYLLAAADGPGFVSRILLAVGELVVVDDQLVVQPVPQAERIRIYVDDPTTPVYDAALTDWMNAADPPFAAPLAGWMSGAIVSYVPISYAHSLRVFLDDLRPGLMYYAQVKTHSSAMTQSFVPAALRTLAAADDLQRLQTRTQGAGEPWFDGHVQLDGAGAWPIWSRADPGTVQRLQFTLDAATALQVMNDVTLRLTWDGANEAAIEATLAQLFGASQPIAPFATWPMTVESDEREVRLSLTLPMPFASQVRLELLQLVEGASSLALRVEGSSDIPTGPFGRLHTAIAERTAPQAGERFEVANLLGPGKYVGVIMSLRGQSDLTPPATLPLGFLEGDERLEVDGEVSLGTGTEEFFGGGWYFIDGPFSGPFSAVFHVRSDAVSGAAEVAGVRWNILSDAIQFQRTFNLSFEYGANRPATASEYTALSFYYR
jgi:Protein of unknown function (DUF2961)